MVAIKDSNERRAKYRFEMNRELRYRVTGDGVKAAAGVGKTLNICSAGVAFTVEQPMREGAFVELSINWPVLLDDSCPMRLIVFGRVLRASGLTAVCSIDKYEFRTSARTNVTTISVGRSDSMLERWADGVRKETVRESRAGV
jgi:hypothetical protein